MKKPTLFLIPTSLGRVESLWLPESERSKILHVRHFVAEASKTARAHLKQLGISAPIRDLSIRELNVNTLEEEIPLLLSPLLEGCDMGLLSEAGCPAVADPGAVLVALAHQHAFSVCPLVGPSSILLALMASGASGQRFAFHGYLPTDVFERGKKIKALERRSLEYQESQIFIETPYRNDVMLAQCLKMLSSETLLCVASDLTLSTEKIISQVVGKWPKGLSFHKKPSIFVIYAAGL